MNDMRKSIPKPRSVFPEGSGDKARWNRVCANEHLDHEMKTSEIVTILMENLCAQADEPGFTELGLIERYAELINWLFEEQHHRGSRLRDQIAELEREAQA